MKKSSEVLDVQEGIVQFPGEVLDVQEGIVQFAPKTVPVHVSIWWVRRTIVVGRLT